MSFRDWAKNAFLLIAVLSIAIPHLSYSRTITVSPIGVADYPTIGQAIATALSGDTIRVSPATYRESVGLKSGVVVLGNGYENTRIEIDILANPVYAVNVSHAKISGFTLAYTGTEIPATVYVQSSRVTISNCRILNTTVSGVYAIEESEVTVEGCIVEQNEGHGVVTSGGSKGSIRDSQIQDNQVDGLFFGGASFGEVTGNTVTGNGANGVEVIGAGPVTMSGNVTSGNTYAGIRAADTSQVDVRGNTTVENGTYGILVQSGSVASIVDNIVVWNSIGGIYTKGGEAGDGIISEIGYNDVWDNGVTVQMTGNLSNYQGFQAPAEDMSVNPFFLDDAAGDYRLRSNSTLIGAGRDGGTVGALGIVSPEEESAVPSPVFIRAFPDTAYWTLLQGQAWLSVDIYIMVGNLVSFIPDEVEVRFFGEDGGIVVSERIPASDFRATSAVIETDVTNL